MKDEVKLIDLIDDRDRVIGIASKVWAERNRFAYRISSVMITSRDGTLLVKRENDGFALPIETVVETDGDYFSTATNSLAEISSKTFTLSASKYLNIKSHAAIFFTQIYVALANPSELNLSSEYLWITPEELTTHREQGKCSIILSKALS